MLNILNNDFDLSGEINPVHKVVFISALAAAVKMINPKPRKIVEL